MIGLKRATVKWFLLLQILIWTHSNDAYLTQSISDKLCALTQKQTIKLGTGKESALLLTQKQFGQKNFFCEFEVEAASGYSLFAVIQNLAFRKLGNKCIDYLTLSSASGTKNYKTFCGSLNVMDMKNKNDSLSAGENAFQFEANKINVRLNINNNNTFSFYGMDLAIAFTSYRDCLQNTTTDELPCDKGKRGCIHKSLFGDGIVNCPFLMCVDEEQCPGHIPKQGEEKREKAVSSNVAVIIIGIILGLAFIILLLWLCWTAGLIQKCTGYWQKKWTPAKVYEPESRTDPKQQDVVTVEEENV